MKVHLIVHTEPKEFTRLLNDYIEKAMKENNHVRDIEYSDNGQRYSALLMLVESSPKKDIQPDKK